MGIVTFMHEAMHNTLFEKKWKNWTFDIIMIPLMASLVALKEDRLEQHRYNRSRDDPDAFTMGKRGVFDFITFYPLLSLRSSVISCRPVGMAASTQDKLLSRYEECRAGDRMLASRADRASRCWRLGDAR